MPNLVGIAGRLPIPKARRLALEAGLIDRGFRRKIAKARKAKDSSAVDELQAQQRQEAMMMREEMDQEYSDRLLRAARRLRLPVPRLFDEEGGLMGDWETGHYEGGYVYLSESGVARVREAIRSEERWHQERRAHWVVWLSAITGIIGALTGLLAVLLR